MIHPKSIFKKSRTHYIKYFTTAIALTLACFGSESAQAGALKKSFRKDIEVPFVNDPGYQKEKISFDFEITSAIGEKFKISDLKGQVVVILFSATWCPNCPITAASIDKIASKLKNSETKNVRFELVYLGNDSIEYLREYNNSHEIKNLPLNQSMSFEETGGAIRAVPFCLVYNKDGEQVFAYLGARDFFEPRFIDFIKELAED